MNESDVAATALRADENAEHKRPLERAVAHRGSAGGVFPFLRHFFEMLIAMWIGMALGGVVIKGILVVLGTTPNEAALRYPELALLVMGLNMTIPMVAWMRHGAHSWRICAEMAAVMLLPAIPLIFLLRAQVIVFGATCGFYSTWMTVGMLALMLYRRDEFGVHTKRRSESTVQSTGLALPQVSSLDRWRYGVPERWHATTDTTAVQRHAGSTTAHR